MQNQLRFLHPKVGRSPFFSRSYLSGVAGTLLAVSLFSDLLDRPRANGLIVLPTLATAKAKSDTAT
jgi:hypothetical protein